MDLASKTAGAPSSMNSRRNSLCKLQSAAILARMNLKDGPATMPVLPRSQTRTDAM